jgi:hypothetical protein
MQVEVVAGKPDGCDRPLSILGVDDGLDTTGRCVESDSPWTRGSRGRSLGDRQLHGWDRRCAGVGA